MSGRTATLVIICWEPYTDEWSRRYIKDDLEVTDYGLVRTVPSCFFTELREVTCSNWAYRNVGNTPDLYSVNTWVWPRTEIAFPDCDFMAVLVHCTRMPGDLLLWNKLSPGILPISTYITKLWHRSVLHSLAVIHISDGQRTPCVYLGQKRCSSVDPEQTSWSVKVRANMASGRLGRKEWLLSLLEIRGPSLIVESPPLCPVCCTDSQLIT
jgi:hypothetical protein